MFDYRTSTNGLVTYKFAGIETLADGNKRWIMAQQVRPDPKLNQPGRPDDGWRVLATELISHSFDATNLRLELRVETDTATLSYARVNTNGQLVLDTNNQPVASGVAISHDFDAVLNRGGVGLSSTGNSSFDNLSVTDSQRCIASRRWAMARLVMSSRSAA